MLADPQPRGAVAVTKRSKGSADLGHAAAVAAFPEGHRGLQWGFAQLRNEETSPRFQIELLHFSEQLIIISLVFPGYLPVLCA